MYPAGPPHPGADAAKVVIAEVFRGARARYRLDAPLLIAVERLDDASPARSPSRRLGVARAVKLRDRDGPVEALPALGPALKGEPVDDLPP
jgi:hypothetical protein